MMGLRRIGQFITYWRKRLRLENWDISYGYGTQEDLRAGADEFLYARILISPMRDCAKVLVFRAKDLRLAETMLGINLLNGKTLERNYEEAVIHELLHIRQDPREKLAGDTAFETGLDLTAEALCDLRYGV